MFTYNLSRNQKVLRPFVAPSVSPGSISILSRQPKLPTEFRRLLAESCSRRFLFVFNFQSFPRGQSAFSHWPPQSTPLLLNLHCQPSTFAMGFLSPKVKKFNFEVGLSNHTIGIGAVLAWNMIEEN